MNIIVGRLAMNRFERKNQLYRTFCLHLHWVRTNTIGCPKIRSQMRCISWPIDTCSPNRRTAQYLQSVVCIIHARCAMCSQCYRSLVGVEFESSLSCVESDNTRYPHQTGAWHYMGLFLPHHRNIVGQATYV